MTARKSWPSAAEPSLVYFHPEAEGGGVDPEELATLARTLREEASLFHGSTGVTGHDKEQVCSQGSSERDTLSPQVGGI